MIKLADLPAPGNPASAVDVLAVGGIPARMTKRNGYNAVEFALPVSPVGTGAGDYALYKYWPATKTWRPEGPRGATPTTWDTSSLAATVPIRVSVEAIACDICIVLTSGAGVQGDGLSPAEVQEQVR